MTPHLPVVTGREIGRVAERLGFALDRQKGSHAVYYRKRDHKRVIIPMHAGKSIKPKTLLGILSDLGLTQDEFRSLL